MRSAYESAILPGSRDEIFYSMCAGLHHEIHSLVGSVLRDIRWEVGMIRGWTC